MIKLLFLVALTRNIFAHSLSIPIFFISIFNSNLTYFTNIISGMVPFTLHIVLIDTDTQYQILVPMNK